MYQCYLLVEFGQLGRMFSGKKSKISGITAIFKRTSVSVTCIEFEILQIYLDSYDRIIYNNYIILYSVSFYVVKMIKLVFM